VVIQSPTNLAFVAPGLFQYSRNITGSGRRTAISPTSPGWHGVPSSRITATRCPATALPMQPGLTMPIAEQDETTRLASVWP
jgi:hypothetical protein